MITAALLMREGANAGASTGSGARPLVAVTDPPLLAPPSAAINSESVDALHWQWTGADGQREVAPPPDPRAIPSLAAAKDHVYTLRVSTSTEPMSAEVRTFGGRLADGSPTDELSTVDCMVSSSSCSYAVTSAYVDFHVTVPPHARVVVIQALYPEASTAGTPGVDEYAGPNTVTWAFALAAEADG